MVLKETTTQQNGVPMRKNTVVIVKVIFIEEGVNIMLKNITYWKNAPVWTPQKIEIETHDWFRFLKD